MSRSLFEMWNLEAVDRTLDTIGVASYSKFGAINYRHELEQRRDEIRELLESMQYTGDDATYSAAYLCLFDALAFLTQAVKGRAVNVGNLLQCQDALNKFRGKAVIS